MEQGVGAWSLDQCREWLARDAELGEFVWFRISARLDSIVALWPESFMWLRHMYAGDVCWHATRKGQAWVDGFAVRDTGDELLDRARLTVMARMRDAEATCHS